MRKKTKVAVLSSHNGSGFDALYYAAMDKTLDLEFVLLISNNSKSVALENAKERRIKAELINSSTVENPDEEIYNLLKESECDYVFLSGYMKLLPPKVTQNFRIINCHPSILPKYAGKGMYGRKVHEAVIANDEKITGVTIHFVNEFYDEGEIILQKHIFVNEGETPERLEKRIKNVEHDAIIESFQKCLS